MISQISKQKNISKEGISIIPREGTPLTNHFPFFAPIYQEITDFTQNPEELITMLSKELYIMDRNMEKLMIAEWQEEFEATKEKYDAAKSELDSMQAKLDSTKTELDFAKTELDSTKTELDIYKFHLKGKTPEEIAEILQLPLEKVMCILEISK